MNRIAISNIAWPGADDAEALEVASATGYSALEIAPVKVFGPLAEATPGAVRAYARRTADMGLPIVAMQGILFGTQNGALFGSTDERSALRRTLSDVAQIAGLLEGIPCVFGAPRIRDVRGREPAEAFEIAVRFFRGIAPIFADQGSTLCFEANPAIYNCNFATHTKEAVALVEAVGGPGFGLQFDAGTVIQNEEPASVVGYAARIASHLHVSQPHLSPITDLTAHLRIAKLVRVSGYSAAISVEMKHEERWRDGLSAAIEAARVYCNS